MVIGMLGPIFAFLVILGIIVGALIVRLARGEGLPPIRGKAHDRRSATGPHRR